MRFVTSPMSISPSSVRWRFLALLGVSLTVFVAMWWALQREDRRRLAEVEGNLRIETYRQLARWIEIADRPLDEFLADYATLPATRELFSAPTRTPAAEAPWTDALIDRHVQAVWLLRLDGSVARHDSRDATVVLPPLPANSDLANATHDAKRRTWFAETAGTVWQMQAAPVSEPNGAQLGWLIVARPWNNAFLAWLGAIAGAEAKLLPAGKNPRPPASEQPSWKKSLPDLHGQPLRTLALTPEYFGAPLTNESNGWIATLFVAFALLLLTAFALALGAWVLRPLATVAHSLAARAPQAVQPLLARRDEFKQVAELVQTSFADRAALEREIDERRRAEEALRASQQRLQHAGELRARLARDLHDHVIQSIYAAGLGLESVRAQMSVDPFGAEGRIRHCMENLNETIRQVRSYINDLEPDSTGQRQQFTDAVRALTGTMRELWPVEFVLSLQESISARLTNVCEIHALQIVRESLSNAIRHGEATRIEIRLREENDGAALLEVCDNGRGFDPVQRMGTGRGLVNLTTRAREMGATLRIDSKEGAGTTVSLRIPLVEARA